MRSRVAAILGQGRKDAECRHGGSDNNCEYTQNGVARAVSAPVITAEAPPRKTNADREEWRSEEGGRVHLARIPTRANPQARSLRVTAAA